MRAALTRGLTIGLTGGLLLALAPAAQADEVRVAATWDDGLAEAQRRNVPVLVVLQRDGRQPFVQHFQQPAFAQFLNDRAVVIVGHQRGGHEPVKRVDRRERREVDACPLYGAVECKAHEEVFERYAGRFDYTDLPAAFICRPDGRAALDGVERMAPAAIMQKLGEAQTGLGEGLFASEIERLERKLQKGDEKLQEGKLGAARKVYEAELEAARKPLLRATCEERVTRLDARALELIEEARGLSGKNRTDTLHRIEREMRGRPPAERAAEVLREVQGQ